MHHKCKICDKIFDHEIDLRDHTEIVHDGAVLAQDFDNKEVFTKKDPNNTKCTFCGKQFSVKSDLPLHMNSCVDRPKDIINYTTRKYFLKFLTPFFKTNIFKFLLDL